MEQNVEQVEQVNNVIEQTGSGRKKMAIFFMSIIAFAFAYVITKDVAVPPWVIIGAVSIGGVVLLFLGLTRPEIVTYVLVAYLPFSKMLVGGFGGVAQAFNLTNLLMIFIMIAWFSGRYAHGESVWFSTSLNFPIILFTLLGCLAVVRGSYYDSGVFWIVLTEFKRWITPIMMFFLVLNTVKEKHMIRNVVCIMIITTTLVGLMAAFDYFQLGDTGDIDRARIGGISDHPNSLAAFFNYYMFLPLGFFLMNMRRFIYWGLWIPFLIQFRGIMVTFSRGGYIAFAAGLYAIIFIRSRFLFLVLLFATVIAFLNPILLPPGIRYRLGQTFEKQVSYVDTADKLEDSLESSAKTRVEVWKGALEMIKENPLFGVGYGFFFSRIQYYWSERRPIDAHNTYLIIAAEMGIPTLLAFLWIVLLAFFNTWALYRTTHDPFSKAVALGFIGGLVGLMAANMFGSRLDSQEVSSYFWILAALIMRLRVLESKEQAPVNLKLGAEWAYQYETNKNLISD